MTTRRWQAILFDFDGVLGDTEPLHHQCWAEVLEPFGIRLDWDTYCRSCIGIADRAMIDFLCRLANPPVDSELVWAGYPRKKELFRRRTQADSPVPVPTRVLLDKLAKQGYELAVVSSSDRAEIEPMLELAGVRRVFGALVCGDDVRRHKPHPEPYLEAARFLGVERALVVEDSDAGCESGRRAGFEVLRVGSALETAERVEAFLGRPLPDL